MKSTRLWHHAIVIVTGLILALILATAGKVLIDLLGHFFL
jgi:hypothetical protein